MAAGVNVLRRGVNALGRDADLVRNREFTDILLRSGPERDATVQMLADALGTRQGRQAIASNADRIAQILLSTEGRQEPATEKAKMLGRALLQVGR